VKPLPEGVFRCLMLLAVCLVFVHQDAQGGGRVPTTYNQRYQAIYAEQELFRKRPELLGCVYAARDFAQNNQSATFNKLRFMPTNVQTGFVIEELSGNKLTRTVRMRGEGRIRAYSFLENWEQAGITCVFVAGEQPRVQLNMIDETSSKENPAVTKE
jgi:hypothetical protein